MIGNMVWNMISGVKKNTARKIGENIKRGFAAFALGFAFWSLLLSWAFFLLPGAALGAEGSGATPFWGVAAGEQLLSSVDFTDIRSHWARESIVRQAAQGILRGYGNHLFRPESAVSRQEAVAAIIRAMGKEEAAAAQMAQTATGQAAATAAGTAGTGGTAAAGPSYSAWAEGALQAAVKEKIISETDLRDLKWTEPARREEVAAWVARAAGLSPVYGAAQRAVYGFRDAASVDPLLLPAVEAALQGGLVQGVSAEELRPKSAVKRAELAVLLDRAAKQWLASRGVAVYEGTVAEKGTVTSGTGTGAFSTGGASGANGSASASGGALRDYVRVLVEGKNPQAAELFFYRGEGSSVPRSGQREAVVYRMAEGKLGLSDLLAAGDEIKYFTRGNEVFYIEVQPATRTKLQGVVTVADAASNEITLQGSDGRVYRLPLSATARVTVNGRFASLSDLHGGEEATLEVRQGEVHALEVEVEEGEPGYLPASLKKQYGQIVRREGQYLYVAVGQGAEKEVKEYRLASFATATRAGEEIPLSEVAPGDWGWLVLEEGGSGRVLSLQLERAAPRLVSLLRGWVAEIQPVRRQLVLKSPERYSGAGWEAEGGLLTVQVGNQAEVFVEGERITLEQAAASNLKGRRCYLAAEEYYGEPQAVRVVICPAYELTFYETTIEEVSHPRQEFALGSRLFSWDAGTLVLQEGRLVDASILSQGQQATVIGVRRGSGLRAIAAVILGGRPLAVGFYRGELYALELDQFRLEDGYFWGEAEKEELSYDGVEIGLNEQTVILDCRRSTDPASVISYKEFVNYRFKQDSAEQVEDFADCDFYVLADKSVAGDGGLPQALIINIRSQDESRKDEERILKGKVSNVDAAGKTVTLQEVKEWNEFYQRWNLVEGAESISLLRAGVALNRRPVNLTALQPGDELYILCDASGAILVSARRE